MTAATQTIPKTADQRATVAMPGKGGNGVNNNPGITVDYLEAGSSLWSCWYIPAYRGRASGAG